MGLSFHSTGCVKGAKECWNESHTLNGSARAAKIKEKPAGLRRQVLVNFFRGKSYEIRDCPNDSRTRLTNIPVP
jgi:hypothetical protein